MLVANQSQYAAVPQRNSSHTVNLRFGESTSLVRTTHRKATVVFKMKPANADTMPSKKLGFIAPPHQSWSSGPYLLRYSRIYASISSNCLFLIGLASSKLMSRPAAEPRKLRDTRACIDM
jgi:hypothetical protein